MKPIPGDISFPFKTLLSSTGPRPLPGFGRSRTTGTINRQRHTQAILRLLGESGSAVLVGSSMGCVFAEAATFERPDLVKGLILADGCLPL